LWRERFVVPPGDEGSFSFNVGEFHFIALLAGYSTRSIPSRRVAWLISDIEAAQAAGYTKIILYNHDPLFADGMNHPSNTNLRSQIGPVIEQYNVPFVIEAHDQAYERTFPLEDIDGANAPATSELACYIFGQDKPVRDDEPPFLLVFICVSLTLILPVTGIYESQSWGQN